MFSTPSVKAQSVFPAVQPTGKPYIIVIQEAKINELSISSGSEIAVFDGDQVAGKTTWNGEGNVTLTAWQADTSLGLPGFTPGNTMVFKIHSQFYDTVLTLSVTASYTVGDGKFGTGAYAAVRLQAESNRVPQATVSTTELNFGNVRLGDSKQLQFELENTGMATLTVVSNGVSGVFNSTSQNRSLTKGNKLTVSVTFSPNQALPQQAELTFSTNDPNQPQIKIRLQGQGLPAVQPVITASVQMVDFGQVALNTSQVQSVTFTNGGSDTLKITQGTVSGTGFSGSLSAVSLIPGGSVEMKIQLEANTLGNRNGTITIQSNASNASTFQIAVTAFVYQAQFAIPQPTGRPYTVIINRLLVDGSSLSNGDQIALKKGETVVGTVLVTGQSTPLSVITAWQADPSRNLPGFSIGDSIELWVSTSRYNLPVMKKVSDVVFLQGDGRYGTAPFTVLEGTLISGNSPLISISKTQVNFDFTELGSTTKENVTVYNVGASPLQVSPGVGSAFSITPNYELSIQPGDSLVYSVSFKPLTAGIFKQTLQLYSNDPFSSIKEIFLVGRGVIPLPDEPVSISLPPVTSLEIPVGSVRDVLAELYNPFLNTLSGNLSAQVSSDSVEIVISQSDLVIPSRTRIPVKFQVKPQKAISDTLHVQLITDMGDTVRVIQPFVAFTEYFAEVKPTGRPFTVILERLSTFGPAFRAGDQIAVYDGDKLVGTKLVTGSTVNIPVTVWQESSVGAGDGFTPGNPISFKVAKVSQGYPGRFIAEQQTVTFTGSGKFGEGSYQIARVRVNEPPYFFWRNLSKIVESNTWENRTFMLMDTTVVDVDGLPLSFEAHTDTQAVQVAVENNSVMMSIAPNFYGPVNVILTVIDGNYRVQDTTKLVVAYRPIIKKVAQAVRLYETEEIRIPLRGDSALFYHPNPAFLSHKVLASENQEIASIFIEGDSVLVIQGLKDGEQDVVISGSEPNGLSAEQRFNLTVRHPKRDWNWYVQLTATSGSFTDSLMYLGASEITTDDRDTFHDRIVNKEEHLLQFVWENDNVSDWNIQSLKEISDSAQVWKVIVQPSNELTAITAQRFGLNSKIPIAFYERLDSTLNRFGVIYTVEDTVLIPATEVSRPLFIAVGDTVLPYVTLGNAFDGNAIKLYGEPLVLDWEISDKSELLALQVESSVDTGKTYQPIYSEIGKISINQIEISEIPNFNGQMSSGVKVRVTVEDVQSNKKVVYSKDWLTVVHPIQQHPLSQGWDLVSIPANPEFNVLDSLVINTEGNPWFAYAWRGTNYTSIRSVDKAESFWMANLAPAPKAWARGSFYTEPFSKKYAPGWHLIASPYLVGLTMDSLQIHTKGEVFSYRQAVDSGYVTELIEYANPGYTYGNQLQPWRGAWLGVTNDTVKVEYKLHSLGLAKKAESKEIVPAWFAEFILKNAQVLSNSIRIGEAVEATDGFDPGIDLPSPPPPPFDSGLSIKIVKEFTNFPLGNLFIQEFRATGNMQEREFILYIEKAEQESILQSDFELPAELELKFKKGYSDNYEKWTAETQLSVVQGDTIYVQIGLIGTGNETEETEVLPMKFEVSPVWPNPFNPTTSLRVSLPEAENIQLEVYSVLGQRVLSRNLGQKQAGHHRIELDASAWSSGLYLIRVKAGNHQQVVRATLLK